ncbi:hypothetical protein GF382_00125 [Candidatus Falkowbacteria bacterium]|nr:hypothetical protein [Candidatus Falkowbacteria bacterium]
MESFHKNLLIFTSLLSFSGALVYRLYSLNIAGITISLILTLVVFFLIKRRSTEKKKESENRPEAMLELFLYLVFFISSLSILFYSRTSTSITSPWQLVPAYFFIFYFLATLALIINIVKKSRSSLLLASLHAFLSFSVLWIVYKIGYGYDPFIHQASMELIKEKGAIDPKPLYYLGQYSLIVILSRITLLPISFLDKILVPAQAAFLLVPSVFFYAKNKFKDERMSLLSMFALFILPFSFATFTTPQNLAYVFLAITIFFSLSNKDKLPISYLLSLTTFFIHPIAGIPAILFTMAKHAMVIKKAVLKKTLLIVIFAAAIFALPAPFYFVNADNNAGSNIEKITTGNLFDIKSPALPQDENIFLNFAYFLEFNRAWMILILCLSAIVFLWFKRRKNKDLLINCALAGSLLISYFITKLISFDYLIDYERSDYPGRILAIAVIMMLPVMILLLHDLFSRLLKQPKKIAYPLLIALALAITASMYASYPRKDNYFDSHGLSVSDIDMKAVEWIESDAVDNNYIVLANQQVSVAALRKIGFRYLDNGMFFYPIPTGGELYKHYLDMVYKKADRQTMLKAMDLSGVDKAYLVLNDYWWAFDKIVKEAEFSADSFKQLENGKIYIFKYIRDLE